MVIPVTGCEDWDGTTDKVLGLYPDSGVPGTSGGSAGAAGDSGLPDSSQGGSAGTGTGGASGNAGNTNTGGTAGNSGTGGGSGTGGTAGSAGTGGTAGAAGTGGTAGAAGTGGTAGAAGTGGSGTVCDPSLGQQDCNNDGICEDILYDAMHCGTGCAPCPNGQVCDVGVCLPPCPSGPQWIICGSGDAAVCVNSSSNPNYCGNCNNACPSGQFCISGKCSDSCIKGVETCDGADNDCDGDVDEGLNTGLSCNVGIGACKRFGVNICNDQGGVDCSATAGSPGVETCNGVDDDCNGLIDDGLSCSCNAGNEICNGIDDDCNGVVDDNLNVGKVCTDGVGACQRFGFIACDGQGNVKCTATAGQPSAETCNGIDDDCDGTADNGLTGCSCYAQPETCDGIDNDCNGAVDENLNLGSTCLVGVGACARLGIRVCDSNGGVTCSATAAQPTDEICNGIDDDCDGNADEGLQCTCAKQPEVCDGRDNDCNGQVDENFFVGSACSVGQGACTRVGITLCNAQGTTNCSATAGLPGTETCNGVDDDCNGQIDEGLDCVCNAQQEVCDGVDNDCDKNADEGFNVGLACTVGTGACLRVGMVLCDGNGGTVCSATAGTAQPEVCNGIDDDCDGTSDNGITCPTCVPQQEVCDGTDNNCNGATDEGFFVGSTCQVGVGACMRSGVTVCDGPSGTKCTATAGQPAAEICNGIDDNCDGVADENLSCACKVQVEVCDGVDNNCDGAVDETFGVGNPCSVGTGACTRVGVTECNPQGTTVCSATAGLPNAEKCNGIDDDCNGKADDGLVGCNCLVQTEQCDGVDNDCDGLVDEGFNVGTVCSVGTGACNRLGVVQCDGAGGNKCSATPGTGTPEICDGIDNDCDGVADNGNVCPACTPQPEICDGVDNDCNGATDEGFFVGSLCSVGTGSCMRTGTLVCNGPNATVCSAKAGTPGTEICNGIDDDCDNQVDENLSCSCKSQTEKCDGVDNNCNGATDEGYNVGAACAVGQGACLRVGIVQCNPQGGTTCSATAGLPVAEICDGIDNDCDGVADENLSCACNVQPEICDGVDNNCNGKADEGFNVGQSCLVGTGACQRVGVILCTNGGATQCSATAGIPAVETCNGIDDDCDGVVDNGLNCACNSQIETCNGRDDDCDGTVDEGFSIGATCAVGTGACERTGILLCNPQGSTSCSATPGSPKAETCNGIDDNCDGQIDEGLSCSCSIKPEICDGVDNNCNGQVDEGLNLGQTCVVGVGACQRTGTRICDGAGGVKCSATAGTAVAEVCNGIDDNCNGQADEGLSCTCNVQTEVCDGIDNDCDKQVDEGFGVGNPCTLGTGACARTGVILCDGAGGTKCSAVVGTPGVETCNGIDDNCNGGADEGLSCTCLVQTEVCDGRDNNCDGQVDETFGVGTACIVGTGKCQRVGVTICSAGAAICSATPGSPGTEICNGVDDDCDGTADEGLSCSCNIQAEKCDGRDNDCDGQTDEGYNVGAACTVGTGACTRVGILLCNGAGATSCSATAGLPSAEVCDGVDNNCDGIADNGISCNCNSSTEICDGRDNDCDGQVDEGYAVGSSCLVGTGACQRQGYTMCSGGVAICSATAGVPVGEVCNGIDDNCNGGADEGLSCTCYPTTEICDGRDNDCDGTVDEGFPTGTQCAVGTGICLRYGYNVCTANHLATQCNAVAGAPAAYEKCNNNLDDDCDGLTDEAGCL